MSNLADVGEVHNVPVSRAQRVLLERAAQALDELGVRNKHHAFARELRALSDAWRDGYPDDDPELEEDE